MDPTIEEYKALLRQHLCLFIQKVFSELYPKRKYLDNFHIHAIATMLEKCLLGETKRLIINVPPRYLKSILVSVGFPAFLLGHRPEAQIICVSYGQELADGLAANCLKVMDSAWYQELFLNTRLAGDSRARSDFKTTQNGGRFSTSVHGSLTGRGGEFIIIDDPHKAGEALSDSRRNFVNAWFDNTVMSRLNDEEACIILVMQRLHEDDLVGHVMRFGNWTVLKFPAIAEEDESYVTNTVFGPIRFVRKAGEALHPAKESLEALNEKRLIIGEYNFAGQYQQAPAPRDGGLIKHAWFKMYTLADLPNSFDLILQSWDTANKATELNDFSVCTTWGLKDKKVYLLDVFRRRIDYPELKRAVRDQASKFGAKNILIEDRASGTQLIQELGKEGVNGVTAYAPKVEKQMRMSSCSNLIENGSVYLPETADWLDEYLHELVIFPKGKYDDQADSTSQALDWIKNKRSSTDVPVWFRNEARKAAVRLGDHELVRAIDEKYGPPPSAAKPEASAPVVFNGSANQPPSSPAVFVKREDPDPELKRLQSRLFWKK